MLINRYKIKLLFLCFTVLLFSCSVQKRKYQKGYFVEWKSYSSQKEKKEPDAVKKENTATSQNAEDLLFTGKSNEPLFVSALNPPVADLSRKTLFDRNQVQNDSCDLLVFKDGSEIPVRLIEISSRQVKYKKCAMPEGPIYISNKTELFMIKYANGSKEVIKTEAVTERKEAPAAPGNFDNPKSPTALATTAFVFSLIGLYPVLFPASIAGLIMSTIQINRIETEPNRYGGLRKARTARIISIIGLFLSFCLYTFII